jgi:hypothetical protein
MTLCGTGERSNHVPANITPRAPVSIVSHNPINPPGIPASNALSAALNDIRPGALGNIPIFSCLRFVESSGKME